VFYPVLSGIISFDLVYVYFFWCREASRACSGKYCSIISCMLHARTLRCTCALANVRPRMLYAGGVRIRRSSYNPVIFFL
jgi:hypothetical protein